MEFKEAVKIALQSLWANKLRSVLSTLAIVIGVAAVIEDELRVRRLLRQSNRIAELAGAHAEIEAEVLFA